MPEHMAACLSKALSAGGVLYDIQMLPFCPLINDTDWTFTSSSMTTSNAALNVNYIVSDATVTKLIMLFSSRSEIKLNTSFAYNYDLSTPIGVKKTLKQGAFVYCRPTPEQSLSFARQSSDIGEQQTQ